MPVLLYHQVPNNNNHHHPKLQSIKFQIKETNYNIKKEHFLTRVIKKIFQGPSSRILPFNIHKGNVVNCSKSLHHRISCVVVE
jgi:hypothetical protein